MAIGLTVVIDWAADRLTRRVRACVVVMFVIGVVLVVGTLSGSGEEGVAVPAERAVPRLMTPKRN